jgi:hypothetical protein
MSSASVPPLPPHRSWGRIALIAVLVLSLLGNAVALGALLRFRTVRAEILGPQAELVVLPAEIRQELRAALRAEARQMAPLLRDILQARVAMVRAATARPYDRAATEAAMEDFRQSLGLLLAEVQVVFLDRLDAIAAKDN